MTVIVRQSRIDTLFKYTDGVVGRKLQRSGVRIKNTAKQLCPVDTGRLRSSIQVTNVARVGADRLSVKVGSAVKYAIFVEKGTRYMRARPYLRPALQREIG